MNENGVKTMVWYCSDSSVKGDFDKQFGVDVKWDIPLLEGYESKFFKNYSWKPSHSRGFFGLINFGMIRQLFFIRKSVIIIHGYHYCTHFLMLLLGKLSGHIICLRCETPQNQEIYNKGWKKFFKKIFLKYILFPRANYFLYIGSQNQAFYKSYGIKDRRLIFCPYSVDDERFRKESRILKASVNKLKEDLGIKANDKIILYSGKYIKKKRPMDLLTSFKKLNDPLSLLIMVGE